MPRRSLLHAPTPPRLQGITPGSSSSNCFLDAWEDTNTRSWSSVKTFRCQAKTRLPPFLSESPRHCLYLHSLYTFNKLCFHLLLALVWFLSCVHPGTLLVLQVPLWVLRLGLLTSNPEAGLRLVCSLVFQPIRICKLTLHGILKALQNLQIRLMLGGQADRNLDSQDLL